MDSSREAHNQIINKFTVKTAVGRFTERNGRNGVRDGRLRITELRFEWNGRVA